MHRLLQGDVGAGKTIVALLAALVAMENGLQVAFMAPTEILAEQHFRNIARLLAAVAVPRRRCSPAARRGLQQATRCSRTSSAATTNLVVGTHALVQEHVKFHKLGLVVIDEQHRFGVVQRATLRAKGLRPDVLVMTATPIPRTLALTVYGDLDVSMIRDLPPGRKPVHDAGQAGIAARRDLRSSSASELDAGRQAYVIYPLVEESEKIDLKAATEMADHLQAEVFPAYRVGAAARPDEAATRRSAVMHAFAAGAAAHPGLDDGRRGRRRRAECDGDGGRARRALRPVAAAPAARPRRPRRACESHCVLLYQAPWTDDARERLKAMADTTDGFVIAERDLELRGPGDFFGTRQSGLPTLRTGDLVRDARPAWSDAHRRGARAGRRAAR